MSRSESAAASSATVILSSCCGTSFYRPSPPSALKARRSCRAGSANNRDFNTHVPQTVRHATRFEAWSLFAYGDGWKWRAQNPAPAHNGLRRRFSDTRWFWRRPKAGWSARPGYRGRPFFRGPDRQTLNRQPERRLIRSISLPCQPDGTTKPAEAISDSRPLSSGLEPRRFWRRFLPHSP